MALSTTDRDKAINPNNPISFSQQWCQLNYIKSVQQFSRYTHTDMSMECMNKNDNGLTRKLNR